MDPKRLSLRSTAKAGFSLAELMVVIVIIGLLATLVVKNVVSSFGQAKKTKAVADVSAIKDAAKAFWMQNGDWPDTVDQLVETDDKGIRFLEQSKTPLDPWQNEYELELVDGGDLVVWCRGKDGVPGGEGDDADFNSQDIVNGDV